MSHKTVPVSKAGATSVYTFFWCSALWHNLTSATRLPPMQRPFSNKPKVSQSNLYPSSLSKQPLLRVSSASAARGWEQRPGLEAHHGATRTLDVCCTFHKMQLRGVRGARRRARQELANYSKLGCMPNSGAPEVPRITLTSIQTCCCGVVKVKSIHEEHP
jgi:hypothetical protein